jgi:subtilisin family serine protease
MFGMRRRLVTAVAVALIAGTAGAMPSHAATDPMVAMQWSLRTIGADPLGRYAGAGVTVAVIDTGVQADHEDLAGAVTASVDCIGSGGDPAGCRAAAGDPDGHGTHVAGIVGARAGNGKGIAGVAPQASIQSVRVLERGCEDKAVGGALCTALGDSADVEAGIRWAIANGADVINLSVADDAASRAATGSPLGPAIEEAWAAGVIVVVASGNDLDVAMGSGYEDVPAIVVAATGPADDRASYSNSVGAARWGMAAPGGDDDGSCPAHAVLSTWVRTQAPNEDYACMDGTSMAAPHVAGAAAVLLSAGFTALQAIDQLLRTAVDLGAAGHDSEYGAGRLDLAAALATPPPVVSREQIDPAATPTPAAAAATAGPATPSRPGPPSPSPPVANVPQPPAEADLAGGGRAATAPPSDLSRPPRPAAPPSELPVWLVAAALVAVAANAWGMGAVRRRRREAPSGAMTPR